MTTLSEIRKTIIINNDHLINAKAAIKSMTNDPLSHFEDVITSDYEAMLNGHYEDHLDDIEFLCGEFLCGEYASDLMQKHDPVMFRCGLNDFADSFDIMNLDEYIDLESEVEELEKEIAGLTEELEELENNLN